MTNPIKPSDPIIGPPRGSAFAVLHRLPSVTVSVREYVEEVYRLAPLVGIDPAIVVAQSAVETGTWGRIPGAGATAWLARRNPGSIGITSTGKPGELDIDHGHSWKDGTDAARGQIMHLVAYVFGGFMTWPVNLQDEAQKWPGNPDPRFDAVHTAGWFGTVRTIQDLSGKWAADKDYGTKIAARGNQLFGFKETPPMPTAPKKLNMTKGLIHLPGFNDENDTYTKRNGVGMNLLGPRAIDVLFFHRALGEDVQGVADWLQRPDVAGMTDWAIDDDTALMIRIEKIEGKWTDMSGWAQGPYRRPTPDLRKLTAKYGGSPDTINRYGESIEVAGFYDDPISPACKRDLAQWTASRAHDRGIEWGDFPSTPDGYSFIHGHREACGLDYKVCPGSVVWAFINDGELIEMTRAIMKTAQTGGTVPATPVSNPPSGGKPAYARVRPIAALAALELDDVERLLAVTAEDGQEFRKVTDQVVAINDTPRFQVASIASTARVGPNIKSGEDFNPAWEFTAKDGEEWYLTPYWTRVRKQDTRVVGAGPLTA